KAIKDWNDLIKPGVAVIAPNPKTSGGARWAFLAAWGAAVRAPSGNEDGARAYVTKLYQNVPVLDSGARGSTTTFAERGIGDVLLSWENEAYLILNQLGQGSFEIVYPSASILCEPPVAVVDRVASRHGTGEVARAYLQYLYSPEGQEIVARNYYRPRLESARSKFVGSTHPISLFTIKDVFGDWKKAQTKFFADNGVFDQIYVPK
ncbi:MAG TPA: sulfate ABC transporter substrate-binding protein, partial [Candidatus Binataceae bacterium]|nr:sulfate ABC transporter substrate-binding protein [Candidatus Binataceae bacterium]